MACTSSVVSPALPASSGAPSAHDVAREYRVCAALADTEVPVPRPVIHVGEDASPLGGPFTVSHFVEGTTLRTREDLDRLGDATLTEVVNQLVKVLATLHSIDPAEAGLTGFGRVDGYAARQLRRWSSQWDLVGPTALAKPQQELVDRLQQRLPEQTHTAIVHGDYRIDNTLLDLAQPRVTAVVDWELSTLGDPVADVAMMCAYLDPAFDLVLGLPSAWASPRMPDAHDIAARYEAAGGAPLTGWEPHLALACLKIATIAAGIDHRHRHGAAAGPGAETAGVAIAPYLERGLEQVRSAS